MRRSALTLAFALFAQHASAAAPDASPFDGCKVTSAGPPTVHVACGQDVLDVTDSTPGERGDAFNEGVILGIKEGAKQPVEQVEFSIELGGAKHRAVRLVSAGTLQWVHVTLRRSEGQRTILCREALRPESRCHPWIEAAAQWIWRAGPPASVPRELRLPVIAGRAYQVPEDCQFVESPGGGTVACSGKVALAWVEAPAAESLNPEPLIANFRRLAKTEATVDCSVERVSTRCWNGAAPDDGMRVYISHAAVVRDKRLVVICLQAGSGLPKACQSVLSLPRP